MKNRLRILILEDNPNDVELVLHLLRQCVFDPEPVLARTEAEYLQGLEQQPDVILADYRLPQFDALQALKRLKETGLDIPYIVISGSIGEEKAVEIIREGATDYLLKDRLTRLGPAIERAMNEKMLRQQKKQTEQHLSELNLQFQTLLDGIPDSLALMTPDLKIVWANRAAEKISALRTREPKGAHCYSLWHNKDYPCNDCPAKTTFRTGQSSDKLTSTVDGRTFAVKTFPLKNEQGAVINVIQWATDITEKKRLRLETERSSRLASLGELSAGIAHEINNPNGIIRLNIPVIKETFIDILPLLTDPFKNNPGLLLGGLPFTEITRELPHMINEIETASQHIKQIVDDLKDYVRGDNFENISLIELNQVVKSGVRMADSTLKKATHHLFVDYSEQRTEIRGHQQQLVQVIVNLLSNACQALPDKSKAIRITTSVDAERQCCMVTVQDQGVGMSEEQLKRSTEPFYTTRRSSGGTGLGLSISAKIIREHGGRLELASKPGQGTTATVILPLPAQGAH